MSSLGTETALESKEPRLYYKYAVLKEKLLTEVYTRWAQGFPEGNDHGPEHIQRVLEKLDQLVGPNPIGTSIRPYELYLAMMSILYHDIGILHSRKNHADEASNELGKKISGTPYFEQDNDNNLFDPFDRDVIRAAVVSHSSSKDIERECQAFPHEFAIGVHVVRPRFIAALVRLADELDEDYRRASQFAQRLTQLPKGSLFYWRFCQRISGIRVERDQHMIVIDAKLEMDDVDYMVEVNKNEQPFTSAFADKLAKINGERRSTNRFLTPALNYSRILVNLRPPDNHPTWVSPKEFFFADGTSSTDFLNILSELLPLNLLDPIIESHPVSPVMPQAIKFQELTKAIFDKSTNDEDRNEHSQEQKRIINIIRDSIEDKELKLSEEEIKKCRQSRMSLR